MQVRAFGCLCLLFAGLLASSAQGQDGLRVAVVDIRKAVFSSREGKVAQEQFSKVEDGKLSSLRPKQDELQRLQEEYEKQKYVLSAEALQDRRLRIVKLRRDLERDLRAAEDELQIEQLQLLQPIQKKVERVVQKIGKDRGFTLIIDKSSPGLLFFSDAVDVTDLVIQELNQN